MEHLVGITVIIGCAAQTPSRWVEVHWMATWRICLESWLIPQWYCRYWRLAAISPEPWRIGIPSGRAVSRLLKIKNPNGTGLEGKASCSMYAKLKLRQCLTKLLSCSFWFSVEACWKAWVCDFHLRNCSAFWPKCLDLETTRAFKFSNSSLASRPCRPRVGDAGAGMVLLWLRGVLLADGRPTKEEQGEDCDGLPLYSCSSCSRF